MSVVIGDPIPYFNTPPEPAKRQPINAPTAALFSFCLMVVDLSVSTVLHKQKRIEASPSGVPITRPT